MNIPIYRAKKIGSDEYVEGFYVEVGSAGHIYNNDLKGFGAYLIDQTTLAIHFPNMTDSQGNKIFASLREDGKGGDIFIWDSETFIVWFDNQALKVNATNKDNFECNCHDSLQEWFDYKSNLYDLEVLGIQ